MTIVPIESNDTTLDPLGLLLIRVLGPKFAETVYISKVNGARKVKSDVQVTISKKFSPRAEFFLRVLGRTVSPTQIFPNFSYSDCTFI